MITLATLADAKPEDIFKQVANHLLTQNKRSRGDGSTCVYKDIYGNKCAAGSLISDEEYEQYNVKGLNSASWHTLMMNNIAPFSHGTLIGHLQNVHDCYEAINWKQKLNELAEQYKFTQID